MKKCGSCKEQKATDEFYNNRSAHDGLDGYCKECRNEYWPQRQNEPSRRNRWGDKMADRLNLQDSDY